MNELKLEKLVHMRRLLNFATITLRLDRADLNLAPEAQKRLFRLIYEYIVSHRDSETISRQSFAFSPEVVSFTVLTRDLPKIQRSIETILQKPNSLIRNYQPLEKGSLLQSILPFLAIRQKRIWRIGG